VTKSVTLVLVLVFLMASFVIVMKPASGTTANENTWVSEAPLNEARNNLGIAAVNSKIYAIGGDTLSGFWTYSMGFSSTPTGGVVGTNEEYDPATNTWTFKTPMRPPRTGFAIADYENKIYCIGGATSHNVYAGPTLTGINEVYDPATDTWETKAPMPKATWLVPANAVDGKIYVIDWDGEVYAYDVAANSWSTKAPAPAPSAAGFDGHVSAVVDGKIHIIGGLSPNEDSNMHQIYNPATDSWTYASPPPNSVGNALGQGAAAATTGELALQRIYVFGQQGNLRQGEPQGSNRVYNAQNDSWTFGANLPTDRINFGVAVLNDSLYVIGGGTATNWFAGTFGPSAANEKYRPFGYGIPDPYYVLETTPPKINVLSPLNHTYDESSVSLAFSVDKQVNWTGYSLDGKQNITMIGNSTTANMTNGLHSITVYANDTFGNMGASETISFTVAEPESFPTTLVAVASVASVALIGVILLIYFRKRKQQQSPG
jgi:N-acetylneuraminic acid mutarotase